MRLFWRSKQVEPSARVVRDEWLEWLRLSNFSPLTIKGYRLTTDRLLARWPELTFPEFNDDHILGVIEESKPASRQARRSAFQNWFQWGVRTKRIERDPMRHVQTYKPAPREPIEVFTQAECKILCSLPEPDGTLMAVLLGAGIRKAEARNLTVKRIDLENGEIQVVEGAKGRTAGIVPIEQKLVQRLAEYFLLEGLNGDRRGLALDDVGLLLRHADSRTTERVYVHTKLIDVRKRMEALA